MTSDARKRQAADAFRQRQLDLALRRALAHLCEEASPFAKARHEDG